MGAGPPVMPLIERGDVCVGEVDSAEFQQGHAVQPSLFLALASSNSAMPSCSILPMTAPQFIRYDARQEGGASCNRHSVHGGEGRHRQGIPGGDKETREVQACAGESNSVEKCPCSGAWARSFELICSATKIFARL